MSKLFVIALLAVVPAAAQITYKIPLPIQVAGCQDATATLFWDTGVDGPIPECQNLNGVVKGVAKFPANRTATMHTTFLLPLDYDTRTELRIMWHSPATTGRVAFQAGLSCTNADEVDSRPFTVTLISTDPSPVPNGFRKWNKANWPSGCAGGELVHLKIWRDPAHVSDTLEADAYIDGVELRITITY